MAHSWSSCHLQYWREFNEDNPMYIITGKYSKYALSSINIEWIQIFLKNDHRENEDMELEMK